MCAEKNSGSVTLDSGVMPDQSASLSSPPSVPRPFQNNIPIQPVTPFNADPYPPPIRHDLPVPQQALSTASTETGGSDGNTSPVFYVGPLVRQTSRSRQLNEARSQITDLQATVAEIKSEAQRLKQDLEKVTQEKTETELQLKLTKLKLKRVEESNITTVLHLNSTISELQTKLAKQERDSKTKIEKYEAQLANLREQLEETKKTHDKTVLELTQEKCQLELKVKDLELKIKDHETQEERLKRQIAEANRETMRVQKEASDNQLKNAEEKIANLERMLSEASLQSQVSSGSDSAMENTG